MGFATHLGPWLLGTVKDTTGTTAGTIRNTGTTTVSQEKQILYNDAATTQAFVLPAGAMITDIQLQTTVAFTSGSTATITVVVGGVTVVNGVTAPSAIGVTRPAVDSTLAAVSAVQNVGVTDALVTYTIANGTAGAANLVVVYAVQNSDGSAYPASA